MPSGFRPGVTEQDILVDGAVIYIGSTAFAALRGDPTFDPGREIRNAADGINGARNRIVGLDRTIRWNPVISGQATDLGGFAADGNTARYLEPGSTEAGTPPVVTPNPGGEFLASGDYVTDLRIIKKRGDAEFFAVKFAKALCVTWRLAGAENDEGLIEFSFEARKAVSAVGDLEVCPYVLERLTVLPG